MRAISAFLPDQASELVVLHFADTSTVFGSAGAWQHRSLVPKELPRRQGACQHGHSPSQGADTGSLTPPSALPSAKGLENPHPGGGHVLGGHADRVSSPSPDYLMRRRRRRVAWDARGPERCCGPSPSFLLAQHQHSPRRGHRHGWGTAEGWGLPCHLTCS